MAGRGAQLLAAGPRPAAAAPRQRRLPPAAPPQPLPLGVQHPAAAGRCGGQPAARGGRQRRAAAAAQPGAVHVPGVACAGGNAGLDRLHLLPQLQRLSLEGIHLHHLEQFRWVNHWGQWRLYAGLDRLHLLPQLQRLSLEGIHLHHLEQFRWVNHWGQWRLRLAPLWGALMRLGRTTAGWSSPHNDASPTVCALRLSVPHVFSFPAASPL